VNLAFPNPEGNPLKKIVITALVLGLSIPTASFAASSTKTKPITKPTAASGAEGTQSHEVAENKSGNQEKSEMAAPTKVKKAKVKKSAKKKMATKPAASPSPTK